MPIIAIDPGNVQSGYCVIDQKTLPKPAGLRDKLSQSPGAMRLLSAACRYRSWALFSRPSVTPSR